MAKTASDVGERIAALERQLEDRFTSVDRSAEAFEARLRRLESAGRPAVAAPYKQVDRPKMAAPTSGSVGPEAPPTQPSAIDHLRRRDALAGWTARERPLLSGSRSPAWTAASLSDLIGGRVLAWVGGLAVLLGLVLFLALAIAQGWIGVEARVVLSALASAALLGGGAWLHDRRGRTEAAVAMVGAATSGMFATLIVASNVYGLIPAAVAFIGSILTGAMASTLAIRWAGRAIGALGLIGALVSPVLVGADSSSAETVALLAVAMACAMVVVVWQRWSWLAFAAVIIAAPQWGSWALGHKPAGAIVLTLAIFAALGLGGAIGAQLRTTNDRTLTSAACLVAINVLLGGVIGFFALRTSAGSSAGQLWLAGLATLHLGLGIVRRPRLRLLPAGLRQVLIALGVVLADVGFGLSAAGIMLALGWSAAAITFAWQARRTQSVGSERSLLGLGLGIHLALVLVRTMVEAPPGELGAGDAQLVPLISICLLAATSLTCGRLSDPGPRSWRLALDGVAMFAIAYLTAAALDGPALVAAWAFEGLALMRLGRSTSEQQAARRGALAFFALAAGHALIREAPPSALLTGVPDLTATGGALIGLAIAAALAGHALPVHGRWRSALIAAAAGTLLYLASLACISAFQPIDGAATETVLDLSVRQQGQVLLSVLWSAAGLAGLIFGLKTRIGSARGAALALLLIAIGKVFLYDLSTLTSIYRVVSFILLGLLLLAGAFAYQRLRPPPQPDLRTVHPTQR